MEMQTLGATGLEATPVGLGLAAAARSRYLNLDHEDDVSGGTRRDRIFTLLDAARDAGIRYLDTGRAQGEAEALLAEWLEERQIPADEMVVASKWGYVRAEELGVDQPGTYLRDHSAGNLTRQWDESHSLLGDRLQIYQTRSATFSSAVLENHAVLDRLAEIKRRGVHIGLTVRGPRQRELIERALEVEHGGEPLFETVQATWNLIERSAASGLRRAHEAGLGVIVKEALANGRLTDRNDDARYQNEIGVLRREAERLDTSPDALALAAALHQPWSDVVLSGAARTDHLESNVDALGVEFDETAESRTLSLERAPEVYWNEREMLWKRDAGNEN